MKMHSNEVETSEAIVKRLLTEQFPEWANLPIKLFLPMGTDNAIYRIGEELSARLPRLADKVEQLDKDHKWLPKLAPHLSLAIPEVVASGKPNEDYPFKWAIYKWLDGRPATEEHITDPNQTADDLVRFIKDLEKIDTNGMPQPKLEERGVPLVNRDASTQKAIAKLEGKLDTESITYIWEEALETPAWDKDSVWIHGDLDGRNVLVKDGRLSAVLDFGCLGVGDPAYDVMAAWKLFSGESRDIFRSKLNVDDATWTRSKGLALSQAVLILSYYTLETNAVLVREAQHWVSEVLSSAGLAPAV
jgi:aminoglycoside phosphotransferase (APT) family kinase protein